ncbi:hypothetical protein JW964_02490, partial [candidate division KSB1 bacterium]|nr:hypothetical protein [candidate division KSB1 bacterium]
MNHTESKFTLYTIGGIGLLMLVFLTQILLATHFFSNASWMSWILLAILVVTLVLALQKLNSIFRSPASKASLVKAEISWIFVVGAMSLFMGVYAYFSGIYQ